MLVGDQVLGETTAVRFFAGAALRPHEEVTGEMVQWLPRVITVEYAGDRPVTGVWRSARGERRICWYAQEHSAALVAAHVERYGGEPFWIIDRSEPGGRRVRVIKCDGGGQPLALTAWDFDRDYMPSREQELAPDGTPRVTRTYECTNEGTVYAAVEQRPTRSDIQRPRPIAFPAPELAGEPFPCGGTITHAGARLVAPIAQNSYQGRLLAVYRDGTAWKRGLATIATSKGWSEAMRPIIDFADDGVAPLIQAGQLEDSRPHNYRFLGVVEALPEGRTLDELVVESPLRLDQVLALAIEIAAVAQRAHTAGHQLGGIRPELVYVRELGAQLSLAGIAHRGPAVIAATYAGEAILWPPLFASDFSSPDDTRGLAQLVWYALTGGHPDLAPDDLRWNPTWHEFRHRRRRRQPWTGPAAIGAVLERAIFQPSGAMDFEALVGELFQLV